MEWPKKPTPCRVLSRAVFTGQLAQPISGDRWSTMHATVGDGPCDVDIALLYLVSL